MSGWGSQMSHSPQTVEYQWSDAWLLVATGLASQNGPISLEAIIAAADAVQHAIPTFDEVDGGLARLSVGDLLLLNQVGFALTTHGEQLLAPTRSGGWHQQQKAIEAALKARPWSRSYTPSDARRGTLSPVITQAEYDAAIGR